MEKNIIISSTEKIVFFLKIYLLHIYTSTYIYTNLKCTKMLSERGYIDPPHVSTYIHLYIHIYLHICINFCRYKLLHI